MIPEVQSGRSASSGDSAPTARGVSKARHDLRDRLAAIQGYGELLLDWRDLPGWDRWRPGLATMNQTTTQIIQQLNQTLEWSRVESGLSDYANLQNSIRTLCQLVLAMTENLARDVPTPVDPVLAMVTRYAGAARKLQDLTDKTLVSLSLQEEGNLPFDLFAPVADETRFLTAGKEGSILVADDSDENRELLRHRLEWQGYTVHLVDNGKSALEFVTANGVDLVLLDIVMPGLDGLETLKRLKADISTSHIPVIMLSSNDAATTTLLSLQRGADDFIQKPFNPILLAARVEASLAKKRLREREKSFYEHTLRLHLGRARAQQVLANPALLRPGAIKHEVSFLFSDISNFSLISDRAAPDRLFKLLNRYYHATIGCIHEHQGTVMQLVGDSIFAIWNAPENQPNHQALACRAAWALRRKLNEFNQEIKDTSEDRLETRLGLHSGDACVGNLGSDDRFEYAAIGANTNLASRLEGLNKHVGTEILITEEMLTTAEAAGFVFRPVGQFKFKGLDKVAKVFELLGEKASIETEPLWVGRFKKALGHFKYKEFQEARKCFRETLQMRDVEDGPSKFYLQQIDKLQKVDLAADWLGVVKMEGK
jgi:class 3 adenylate cyclase